MRSLCTSEILFQQQLLVDQDGDGVGEYALLDELKGSKQLRSRGELRSLADLGYTNIPVENGVGEYNGYLFKIYLPYRDNAIYRSETALDTKSDQASIDLQEQQFVIYSWPTGTKNGKRCFVIDASGEVCSITNTDDSGQLIYSGDNEPAFDSALSKDNPWQKRKITVWQPAQ